jgi:hypothetical protein
MYVSDIATACGAFQLAKQFGKSGGSKIRAGPF